MQDSHHIYLTDLLSPYLEGDLDSPEREEVETHLSTCASCQRELDLLKKTAELVHNLPLEEPSPDFLIRVNQRIDEGSWFHRFLHRVTTEVDQGFPVEQEWPVSAMKVSEKEFQRDRWTKKDRQYAKYYVLSDIRLRLISNTPQNTRRQAKETIRQLTNVSIVGETKRREGVLDREAYCLILSLPSKNRLSELYEKLKKLGEVYVEEESLKVPKPKTILVQIAFVRPRHL